MASLHGPSNERTSLRHPLRARDTVPTKWEIAERTGVLLEGEELAEAQARMTNLAIAAPHPKPAGPRWVEPRQMTGTASYFGASTLHSIPSPSQASTPGPLAQAMRTTGVFDGHSEAQWEEFHARKTELHVWKNVLLAHGWRAPAGPVKVNWDAPLEERPNWADVYEWRRGQRMARLARERDDPEVGREGYGGEGKGERGDEDLPMIKRENRKDSFEVKQSEMEDSVPLSAVKRRQLMLKKSQRASPWVEGDRAGESSDALPRKGGKFGIASEQKNKRAKITPKRRNPRSKAAHAPVVAGTKSETSKNELQDRSDDTAVNFATLAADAAQLAQVTSSEASTGESNSPEIAAAELPARSAGRSTRSSAMGKLQMQAKREAYLARKHGA